MHVWNRSCFSAGYFILCDEQRAWLCRSDGRVLGWWTWLGGNRHPALNPLTGRSAQLDQTFSSAVFQGQSCTQFNSPDDLQLSRLVSRRWQRKYLTSLKKSVNRLPRYKVCHQWLVRLTVVTEHYVKKDLLSRQIAAEIRNLSSPTALSRFGGPFRPLDPAHPVTAATTDFPFLRFVFVNFVQSFPFLPNDQGPLWQDKVQPVPNPVSSPSAIPPIVLVGANLNSFSNSLPRRISRAVSIEVRRQNVKS